MEGNVIILNIIDELDVRMWWDSTVIAYGCRQHPLTNSTELSKSTYMYTM